MRIFLFGMMGSGKSTLGKKLAQSLSLTFIDLDTLIESKEGRSISEIFTLKGEEYFRKAESDAVREVCKQDQILVATGGGAPCYHDNLPVMNAAGITIFLDVPISTLTDRLLQRQQMQSRPLVQGKSKQEMEQYLTEIYELRKPFYHEAKLVIKGADISEYAVIHSLEAMEH